MQITPLDSVDTIPGLDGNTPGYAVWLTLLQNHENKTVEMLLTFTSDLERTRWVEAVTPALPDTSASGERVYEQWDCPRVEIIASYIMSQFLVMVIQATITFITVFLVFQIPCHGPIAWCMVLALLQGKFSLFKLYKETSSTFFHRLGRDEFWILPLDSCQYFC